MVSQVIQRYTHTSVRTLRIRKGYLCVLFMGLLAIPHITLSQRLTDKKWYFGNSKGGILFDRPDYTVSRANDQATPFSTGGSAVATDPTSGNLLFYTDGNNVYDACHNTMPNGTGLNSSHVSTPYEQPVAISAIPGQRGKYYIFTSSRPANTAGKQIYMSVVDMNSAGNAAANAPRLGALESFNTATGLTNRSEGMVIVPHSDGKSFWLITHEVQTKNYVATLIDATTYNNVPSNNITSTGIGKDVEVARMTYSPIRNKIAISVLNPKENAFIVNFDNTTGTITFDRNIPNDPSFGTLPVHDVSTLAWSPSSRYLYLSTYGNNGIRTGSILQYDYKNTSSTLASVPATSAYGSYGLQTGPDSAIYHLYRTIANGPILVGKLTQTDSAASKVQYEATPFGNIDFAGFVFPAFLPQQNTNLKVSFVADRACQNSPTTFYATVTPGADSLSWAFGDGTKGRGVSVTKTYQQPQTQTVSLTAFYNGQRRTSQQSITVNPFSLSLQLVKDTTACRSEFPPPRGSSTPKQFTVKAKVQGGTPAAATWSNGNVGTTLSPDSAGYYYIVVSDASGCSAYASVNVKEYKLEDQRTNIWYFGNKAGIDFNPLPDNPPVALSNSAMNAPEGTATISDHNGDVIFYTDGDKVYDKTHTVIDSGIGGDPASAQAAQIIPVKDHEGLYYIFTTKAMGSGSAHELRYSLFDLKQNNGRGSVVIKNALLYAQSTERIATNESWLISHEYGNNTFRAYAITKNGIGSPIFSDIGSSHSFKSWQTGEGYMTLSSKDKIAVALSNPGVSNSIEIFNFNKTNGEITDYDSINLNEPNGQVYGVAFSSGGKKLFATLRNTPSTVYEYYLDTLGKHKQINSMPHAAGELGAIQQGPDGQTYIAINGSNALGTITVNEDSTRSSSISFSGFSLASGTLSGLGLPSFVQSRGNTLTTPSISADKSCLGDSTHFQGTATDPIDKFAWKFGDGAIADSVSPVHLYSQTATYNVTMQLTNRCGLDTTLTTTVTISPASTKPTIPSTAILCQDTVSILLDANSNNLPGYTYLWSTKETTKTIRVRNPSIVSVTTTNTNQCKAKAQIFVADNRPTVALGANKTLCASATPSRLDASNPGANYNWQINGVAAGTEQVKQVDQSKPGVYLYKVTVTDPITNCLRKDSTVITILDSPLSADFGQSDACMPTVTLTANPVGAYTYTWYKENVVQSGLSGNTVSLGLSEDNANYAIEITNPTTQCSRKSKNKRVNVVGIIKVSLRLSKACKDGKPFTLKAITNIGSANYTWFLNNSPIPNANIDTTSQFSEGVYKVEVKKSVCSASSDTTAVRLPTPAAVKLPNRLIICNHPENVSLQAFETILDPGEYNRYEWFKNDTLLSASTRTLTAKTAGTYKVIVRNSNACTNSGQTDVVNDCIPVVEAPTAFRPGSQQAINKTFSLFSFFITNTFSIAIYNRWGELIYQSSDRFFKWDGTHQITKESAPLGMYTYLIKYVIDSHPDRGVQKKRGSVMLIR